MHDDGFPRVVRGDDEWRLWDAAEVARRLHVSVRTVRRWTSLPVDPLPAIRMGATNSTSTKARPILRFDPDDVRRWASKGRRTP